MESIFKILCLAPFLAIIKLEQLNPYRIILTSGTLPDKSTMEEITGLIFSKYRRFK